MKSKKNNSIHIGRDLVGKTLTFDSKQELTAWLADEKDQFSWITKIPGNFALNLFHHIETLFLNFPHYTLKDENELLTESDVEEIVRWFAATYGNKALYYSSSSEMHYIRNIAKNEPELAAYTLAHLIKFPRTLGWAGFEKTPAYQGAAEAVLLRNGLLGNDLNHERGALDDLKNDWDFKLTKIRSLFETSLKEMQNELSTLSTYSEQTRNTFEELKSEIDSKHKELLETNRQDLENLKSTYDKHMSLQAPVEYWISKRKYHQKRIPIYTIASIIVGLIGAILMVHEIHSLFEVKPMTPDLSQSKELFPYWRLGILIFLGTLGFWLLRMLVRLLVSHIHLESDAHEREVMAKTYLSLLRNSSGLDEGDKKLILTTLFRPASNGLINDDGIPPGIYDLLTKFASK
ncbi:DUF6161 domain-containing protein [Bdellovibrio bacteriovorus]|uniref:DUF6161 domain-containing protein n=1 Tax=Bdellovibrio bacteriovorus TaxID=959 RepID=UPI0035A59124